MVTRRVPLRHRDGLYLRGMKQYLILIEQLVRDGKSEREIEEIVGTVVEEDVQALDEQLDEELRPAA